jgi:hypothetical protein
MLYEREKTARRLRDDQFGRMWKFATVALAACVAVAALAWFRPWEGRQEGLPHEEIPVRWRQFRSTAFFRLENTEYNFPITNFAIHAPFPRKFENLHLMAFRFLTAFSPVQRGNLHFDNGILIENTLEGPPPSFTVEYVPMIGYRAVMRSGDVRLGDSMFVAWTYWAPENTSLFDEPDNKVHIQFLYQPNQEINTILQFNLYYEDNYADAYRGNLGKTWWRWMVAWSWFEPGWHTRESVVPPWFI